MTVFFIRGLIRRFSLGFPQQILLMIISWNSNSPFVWPVCVSFVINGPVVKQWSIHAKYTFNNFFLLQNLVVRSGDTFTTRLQKIKQCGSKTWLHEGHTHTHLARCQCQQGKHQGCKQKTCLSLGFTKQTYLRKPKEIAHSEARIWTSIGGSGLL